MQAQSKQNQPLRILIVDDEVLLANLIRINLELKGYTVCAATHSGTEALEIALCEQPNVVIIDVRLGSDDGITVAEQIQHCTDAAIIFTTGSTSLDDWRRAREFNPYAFLIKPVPPEKLLALLDELQA